MKNEHRTKRAGERGEEVAWRNSRAELRVNGKHSEGRLVVIKKDSRLD